MHLPLLEPLEALNQLKDTDFGIVLNFDSRYLDYPKKKMTEVKKLTSDVDNLSIHGPFMDLNAGSIDERVRNLTMYRYNQALNLCEFLGAKTVIFHTGYSPFSYDFIVDLWIENSIEAWNEIAKEASKIDINIHLENSYEDKPEVISQLLEKINAKNISFCFDVGHANVYSEENLDNWMYSLRDYIKEVHLHDNDGKQDLHKPLGEGNIDFSFLTKFKDIKPRLTLEMMTLEDVSKSVKFLEDQNGRVRKNWQTI